MAARGNQVRRLSTRSDRLDGEIIFNDLTNLISGDTDAIQSVVDLFITLFNKIQAHEIEAENTAQIILETNQKLAAIDTELRYTKNENETMRHKLSLTDDATRTMYLRLEGLSEENNANLPLKVANSLSKTGVTCTVTDIDYVRRVGKYKEGEARPILVRFVREGKRNSILYNRANINKNKQRNDPLMWVNDDVSEETRRNRKSVRDIATLAKQTGITGLKIHGDGIILNNNKYKHDELDLLPPSLSLQKAKSREEENDIYFQGEESPFSNFHHSRFSDDQGQVYENIEQAFQYKKAKANGKLSIANKILATRDPIEIKKLSKQIPNTKEWNRDEEGLMKNLVTAKFTQNKHLGRLLIKTGDKQLHESTSNKKWGTGAELSSKALLTGNWDGQDLLGQLIEEVRNELKTNSAGAMLDCTPPKQASADPDQPVDDLDNITPMPEGEVHDLDLAPDLDPTTVTKTPSRDQTHTEKLNRSTLTEPDKTPVKDRASSAGSPTSTQAIIHGLSKKPKRIAPTPPKCQEETGFPRLRGNRPIRSTAAANKGKK